MSRRSLHILVLLYTGLAVGVACDAAHTRNGARADSTAAAVMSAPAPAPVPTESVPELPPRPTPPPLTGDAASMARMLVFFVNGQRWLTAAVREHRLVVDIGRVDAPVTTPAQRRAYQEAVQAESPLLVGDRLRVHGPWGSTDVVVSGFAQASGRIVATLELPPALDSLVRASNSLVAVAERARSAAEPVEDQCTYHEIGTALRVRLRVVRDSIERRLRAGTARLDERQRGAARVESSFAVGCFGAAHVLLIASVAAADFDDVREVAALLDDAGHVTPLRLKPLRFATHEALSAFDADGDGVDDVAVRGRGARMGGTAVLRLDVQARQLDFLTQGFAWEGEMK